MPSKPFHLILGSQSPRRKELLGYLGVPFQQLVSGVNEISSKKNKTDYVLTIAQLKMDDLWPLVTAKQSLYPNWNPMLITCDTIVALGSQILGKPQDENQAKAMLRKLSGRSHFVYTALCYRWLEKKKIRQVDLVDKIQVTFFKLENWLIDEYVASKEPMDKAGAYGLQGYPQMFLKKMEGNYSSVVGFPLGLFCDSLKVKFKLKNKPLKTLFINQRWF